MIKRIFKAIGSIFAGIQNFFTLTSPPLVVHTQCCVHCGFEYPHEYLTKKTIRREGSDGKCAYYYLYLCPACILLDPKFHHAEITRGSWMRYFWEEDDGKIYEFYKFENDSNSFNKTNRETD